MSVFEYCIVLWLSILLTVVIVIWLTSKSNETENPDDIDIQLEADFVKQMIIRNLVSNNLIEVNAADQWCATHTLMRSNKPVFRTMSVRYQQAPSGTVWFVVSCGNENNTLTQDGSGVRQIRKSD